jgi:nucleotide-binding universal stress UspA family protein
MRILIPVDGSPASTRAVKLGINQAKSVEGASLLILNVQNLATLALSEGASIMPPNWIEAEEEKAATEAMRDAVAACGRAGVSYATRRERGPIAATIDRVAREEHAHHIIMGTRGLGNMRGLIVGSVATQVLHLVDVPVTLVK